MNFCKLFLRREKRTQKKETFPEIEKDWQTEMYDKTMHVSWFTVCSVEWTVFDLKASPLFWPWIEKNDRKNRKKERERKWEGIRIKICLKIMGCDEEEEDGSNADRRRRKSTSCLKKRKKEYFLVLCLSLLSSLFSLLSLSSFGHWFLYWHTYFSG